MYKELSLSFHAGTAADRIMESYLLPPHMTGAVYEFLLNVLLKPLEDADLHTRICLWFRHDGV
jgi:hypothetical protein